MKLSGPCIGRGSIEIHSQPKQKVEATTRNVDKNADDIERPRVESAQTKLNGVFGT